MKEQLNPNEELALMLHELSSIYKYFGKNKTESLLYKKAAKQIDSIQEDITVYVLTNTIQEIPGIDKKIFPLIVEYVSTGEIKKLETARKKYPYELIDLIETPGVGQAVVDRLHSELKIKNMKELEDALENGSVGKLKRLGAKKIELMVQAVQMRKSALESFLLWKGLKAGGRILEWMNQSHEVKELKIVGSLRRRKEIVRNINVLASADKKDFPRIIKHFTDPSFADHSVIHDKSTAAIILKGTGKKIRMHLVEESEWGSSLIYYTGSSQHYDKLAELAKRKGYRIDETGVYRIDNDRKVAGRTEEGVYKVLGLTFIPPELRENRGELDIALSKQIPELINLSDIKGDLQIHTNWSDGRLSLEKMVSFLRRNFSYEYVVISDHSKSSGGMDEKEILKQVKTIREINKKLGVDFIKYGVEVDILQDGKLDISNEILKRLDWVTASIHRGYEDDNTERLIRACENPFVHCITHPTGRMIGIRKSYKVDFSEVIEAAKHTGTALEINAQPLRMDLNEEYARKAKEKGVLLTISTDAHDAIELYYMKLGIAIARRAGCRKKDILNTKSWKEIAELVPKKRSRAPVKIIVK